MLLVHMTDTHTHTHTHTHRLATGKHTFVVDRLTLKLVLKKLASCQSANVSAMSWWVVLFESRPEHCLSWLKDLRLLSESPGLYRTELHEIRPNQIRSVFFPNSLFTDRRNTPFYWQRR